MLNWIVNTLDRIFVVFGALIFSQIPLFMRQYQQQLAGHIAELQFQIESIKQAARLSGKTLELFIQKFISHEDMDFVRQGEIMQHMTERYQALSECYVSLSHSSPLTKPFIFLSNLYWDIAKSTYRTFHLGLEFSLEGFSYAFIGIFFGYFLFAVFKKSFEKILDHSELTI